MQAMVAREMVERMGVPVRRAAELLGIAPSAVSQYLTGKRQQVLAEEFLLRGDISTITRELALQLVESQETGATSPRLILEAAARMSELVSGTAARKVRVRLGNPPDRALVKQLRQRIAAEQESVTECMQLAQKARDELTRAIFRQIASDSLRHAEIVASLSTYLERGVNHTLASGISTTDVEQLIASERTAEAQTSSYLQKHVGGVMSLLLLSMKADERKHDELLSGLLHHGFSQGSQESEDHH